MTRTKLFDAIRAFAPDQRFSVGQVMMIDDLADSFGLPIAEPVSAAWLPLATAMIKQFEALRLNAYPDPASGGDPWTIGYGSTGEGICKGVSWTIEQCNQRLASDVTKFAAGVDRLLGGAPTNAHQKAALVSLAYNIGLDEDADTIAEGLGDSTLLRKHKTGDYAGAAAQFPLWNKANGRVMNGLTKRRAIEARVYQGGEP